jgi:HEAT repeat protein
MSELPRTTDPFIGLEPFTEAESDRFFGREAQTRILVHKIRANKLTLLVAASGVGKSSLLEAGVKRALRKQGGHALLSFRTWYGDPLAELKAALAAEGRPALDQGQPLAVLLRLHALIGGKPLILFLDQFEELFNYQCLTGRLAPLVQELSEAINDHEGPAALVISMREDFAMELNAFKPHVNSVFDNYYRLEKLDLDQAWAAMVRPLTDRGWDYEVGADGRSLADTLLDDLGHREYRERLGVQQLADPTGLPLQVEPPHLQIVCKTLWDLDRADPGQRLRLATYRTAGRTNGILDGHFRRAMAGLGHDQRRLASRAFDYLVGQQGTKLAYPVDELAERCHAKPVAMDDALAALDRARVLRRSERVEFATGQTRIWFELYHDVFARSVRAWNRDFKARERLRHTALAVAGVVLALGLAYLALDLWSNHQGRFLALSPLAGVSDRIEVRSGDFDLPTDLLGQGGFLYETDRVRGDIEADRRFGRARIGDRPETGAELISRLPVADRLPAYGRDGLLTGGFALSHLILTSKEWQRDRVLIDRAARSLGKVRHPRALSELIRVSKEAPEPETRNAALHSTAGLGTPEGLEAIAALLEDPDSNVRQAAIEALAVLGATQAADAIAARLEDPDSNVRQAAIKALAVLGATQAADAIAARLEHQDWHVRRAAIEALAGLGVTPAADAIAERLKDQDSPVIYAAIKALASLGATQYVDAIAARLEDLNWNIRRAAIEALAGLGATQAADAIAARLEDRDLNVRQAAIDALTGLGATQAADAIAAQLKDPDWNARNVRQAAIKALASLGVTQAADAIAARLEDRDKDVRQAAIDALTGLGATQAADTIAARLEGSASDVPQAAIVNLPGGPLSSVPFNTVQLALARAWAAWAALGRPWSQDRASRLFAVTEENSVRSSLCPTVGASGGPPAAVAWCADRALSLVGNARLDRDQIAELGDLATVQGAQRLTRALGEQDANAPEILEALARIGEFAPDLILPHLDTILALASTAAPGTASPQIQAAAIRALGRIHAFRGQTRPKDLPDLDRRIVEALASLAIGLDPKHFLVSLATLDALGLSERREAMNRLWALVEQHKDSADPIWAQHLYPKALFWLGRVGHPPAAEPLAGRLEALAQEKAQWRRERNQAEQRSREGTPRASPMAPSGEDGEAWLLPWPHEGLEFALAYAIARADPGGRGVEFLDHPLHQARRGAAQALDGEARLLPWPHEGLEFTLAYAIARADPGGRGVEFLDHPLHEARRGAAQALASWAPPPVFAEILRRLQDFDADRLPRPFPTAAYRVLDGGLHVLELGGTTEELEALGTATAGVCEAVSPIDKADVTQAAIAPPPALEQIQRAACDRLRWTLEHADFNSLVRDVPPPLPPSP